MALLAESAIRGILLGQGHKTQTMENVEYLCCQISQHGKRDHYSIRRSSTSAHKTYFKSFDPTEAHHKEVKTKDHMKVQIK